MDHNGFHTVRGYQLLGHNKKITSAMEDYLEMIYRNRDKNGGMRINDLAALLHVKASSTTKMVQKLGALGFLHYEKYGNLVLTDEGQQFGAYLLRRHKIIAEFLKLIGTKNALLETELIEHNVSPQTLQNIDNLLAFFTSHPDILAQYKHVAFDATILKI